MRQYSVGRVRTVLTKNWEPPLFGPAFAILKTSRSRIFRFCILSKLLNCRIILT